MGLRQRLGSGRVALDTAIFIYFVEQHPQFASLVRPLFLAADQGSLELVTSSLTLLEVQVVPYRTGNVALAERYAQLLSGSRGLTVMDIDRDVLRAAAKLRAECSVRTPDALQLAAAQVAGCSAFLTNDRRLPTIGGLRVVQLSDEI